MTGTLRATADVPGDSDTCTVVIDTEDAIENSMFLMVDGSAGCLARAEEIMDVGATGCRFGGLADVVPQAAGGGLGFAYAVDGTQTGLQVVARSKHVISAEVHTIGPDTGGMSATSSVEFSIIAPVIIVSVPFGISHDSTVVTVNAGDSSLSRQAGSLTGMSAMTWRIVRDDNRNGLVDLGESFVVLSGGESAPGNGVNLNGMAPSQVIDRGLYVLEVTFETLSSASATTGCFIVPSAASQSDTEDVAMRLNLNLV